MPTLLRTLLFIIFLGQLVTIGQAAENAVIPGTIQFSGSLPAAAGPTGITFALYSEQAGGSALWMETQNVIVSDSGSYSVLLGAATQGGIPQSIFSTGQARWLEVSYTATDGPPIIQSRVLLVSVPYAMKSGDSETLGGLPASAFMLQTAALKDRVEQAGGLAMIDGLPAAAVSGTGTTNRVTKWFDALGALGDSLIHDTGSAIGIGTATPGAALDIQLNNSAFILGGAGTHSFALQGALSNGRFGQDSEGVFFASDTDAKVFKFLTTSGALTERMRIASNGFVGIGTNLPGATLDIAQDNASLIIRGTGTHSLSLQGALSNGRFGQDSEGMFFASDTNGKAFKFLTNSGTLNEWMRITSAGNVGIGTTTPAATLDVNGPLKASTVFAVLDVNLPATGTITLGSRFLHRHGTGNTFLGESSGNQQLISLTGSNNTASGAFSLAALTSGSLNTSVGMNSLFFNQAGSSNAAVGASSLQSNEGSFNTAMGAQALFMNFTGSNNTALGYQAGKTSNNSNANQTGSNNTFLGYNAGPGGAAQLSNATAVGASAVVSASNALVLGSINGVNGASATVNVGIGTASPTARLHVAGTAGVDGIRFPDDTLQTTAAAGAGPAADVDCAAPCISTAEIVDSAVTTSKISDSTISTAKIADGAITTSKLANVAVDGSKLLAGAVTTNHLVDGAVTTAKIFDNSIINADIALSAAISPSKIAGTAATLDGNQAFDSSTLVIDSAANRVGIGTVTPEVALDVWGANPFVGTSLGGSGPQSGTMNIMIPDSTVGADKGPILAFGGYRANGSTDVGVFSGVRGAKENSITGNRDGYLGFYTTQFGVAFAERLRITSTGRVGIGTATPVSLIQAHSNGASTLRLNSPSGSQAANSGTIELLEDDTETFAAGGGAGAHGFRLRYDGNTNLFSIESGNATNTFTHLAMNRDDGNVGVGTTTADTRLTVGGDGAGLARLGGGTGCGGNYAGLGLNGQPFSACTNYNLLSSPTDPNLYLNRPAGAAIQFRENNNPQMVIVAGGDVGIGTTTPNSTAKLHVATAEDGPSYGVYGENSSTAGFGVAGVATSASGVTTGVYGRSDSANGMGGWFRNFHASGTILETFNNVGNPVLTVKSNNQVVLGTAASLVVGSTGSIVVNSNASVNLNSAKINGGVNQDGGGIKHKRVVKAMNPSTLSYVTVAWDTPFNDTNYTATVALEQTGGAGACEHIFHTFNLKTASSIQVAINNTLPDFATCVVNAIAIHD